MSTGLEFFESNVDNWGALEWFERLVNAVEEQDKAVLAGDDVRFEICRMVAATTAMRLAREYGSEIKALLSSQPHKGE